MSWSWSELLRANGGDEERALRALGRMPGVGRYRDETHRPSTSVPPPVDTGPSDRTRFGAPCRRGSHPRTIRNGRHPSGHQKWVCRECQDRRRQAAIAAAGGG